jgi:hypothetical protein
VRRPIRIGPGTQAVDLISERPDSVKPGIYASGSNTPAYSLLRAMIAAKDADLLGERYAFSDRTPQGWIKLTTAGVKRAIGRTAQFVPRRVAANPVIGMGAESFVSELQAYDKWQLKWWREVVQNSVDAGARRIDLAAHEQDDGTWIVSATDDGGGMPEEILVTKFLYLGATTKVGQAGAAGGFGVAKKLILLPWLLWEVITGDVHVVGHGVSYFKADDHGPEATAFFEQIGGRPRKETRHGTTVRVTMPGDRHTDNVTARAFLEKCYLPRVKFTVNGNPVRANLKAKEFVEGVPGKADVFFTKVKDLETYHLLVRSNGLFMFEEWIEKVEGVLIAEITAPSIQILTSNRDGFRDSQVKRMIRDLANRIAVDRKSALRKKRGIIRKKYSGAGKFKAAAQEAMQAEALASAGNLTPSSKGKIGAGAFEGILDALRNKEIVLQRVGRDTLHGGAPTQLTPGQDEALNEVLGVNLEASAAIMAGTSFGGVDHVEAAVRQLVWEPDFYVYNNIEGFRVPKKFFPEDMTPTLYKLAKVWTETCRYVLIQLGCPLPFGVGWIFEEGVGAAYQGSTEGEHYFERSGEHWLLLNPFQDARKRKAVWRPSKAKDLKWLYAAAIHEATHMADGLTYHNESFAAALTRNMATCADGFKHIRKLAGSIKMTGSLSLGSAPGMQRRPKVVKPKSPLDKITKKALIEYMGLEGPDFSELRRETKGTLMGWALENGQITQSLWSEFNPDLPYPTEDELFDMVKKIP